ncbi:MAG TPA: diguanylate cyclase, partial [Myxococcota bacterium]|nr:diguanylate cyclase [Myxococcota bacterium]
RVKQRNPDQDIVVVTGVLDIKAAVDAMKLGATEYLLKPFDRDALVSTLEDVLQSRRLRNEHSKLLSENIEYLDERSLLSRATALFAILTIEPLAERIVDGLCVETGAQGGVLWAATRPDRGGLELACARGLVRVENEQEWVALGDLPAELAQQASCSAMLRWGEREGDGREALYLALRDESRVVGLIRLTDKVGGEAFDAVDRSSAEKFAQFAQTALCNALRYRALERKTGEDTAAGATDFEYFFGVARSEVEKASRHGRCFSILKVEIGPLEGLRAQFGDLAFRQWIAKAIAQLTRIQRASDLLSSDGHGRFLVLLPETDVLGAAQFKRRAFDELQASDVLALLGPKSRAKIHVSAASYPSDGTQLETLLRLLDERIEGEASSWVREMVLDDRPLVACLAPLLARGGEERREAVAQIAEFVLAEPARRTSSRSLLFASPGGWLRDALIAGLEALGDRAASTSIFAIGEPPKREAGDAAFPNVSWIAAPRADRLPAFLIYFGEGCAYAMVCEGAGARERTRFFQTCDRNLVEHLALRAQHELAPARSA